MPFASGLPMKPGEVKTYPTQIKKKESSRSPVQPSRDRNDWLLRNGSPEQARESARVARQRQGEREE